MVITIELENVNWEGFGASNGAQLEVERLILEKSGQVMTYHSVAGYKLDAEGNKFLGAKQMFNYSFEYQGGDIREESKVALTQLMQGLS